MIPCTYASDSTIIEPLSTHHSGSVMTSFDSRKERGGGGNRSGDHYGSGHYGESRKRRSSGERGVSRDHKRSSYDEVDSGRGGGDDTGYKRRRVLDGGSLGLASKATLNWRQDGEDDDFKLQTERPKGEAAYEQASVKKRDKRMFGALMGHLGAAKKRLENDKDIFDKQKEVAKVVTMKVEKACSDAREKAEQARRLANAKEFVRRKQYTLQNQKSRRASSSEKWIAYQKSLVQFLMTKTSPPLPWLPVEHTGPTSAMQDERKVEIDRCIAERLADDVEFCKLLDEEVHVVEEDFARDFGDDTKSGDNPLDESNTAAGDSTAEAQEGQEAEEEYPGREATENESGEYKVVGDEGKEGDKDGDDEDEVIVEASSK